MHAARLTFLTILAFIFGSVAMAQAEIRLEPKIASFDFFVDHSGSMMMKHEQAGEQKIVMARDFLLKVNNKVPMLPYDASVHTFAPFKERMGLSPYSNKRVSDAVESISIDEKIRARFTPLGDDLMKLTDTVHPMKREGAVILVSDGVSNKGADPVAQAKALYRNEPGICLHVVSFADKEEGKQLLKSIADLNGCSVYAEGPELLTNDVLLDQFMQDVFYRVVEVPEPVVVQEAPAEEAPVVVVEVEEEETIVLRNVTFAFDSAKLDNESQAILTEAALLLEDRPGTIIVTGHTDSTGPEAYNMDLSLRRAQSVRQFLISEGLPAERLVARGKGEHEPEFDNSTKQGRALNRRVVVSFE